MSKVEIRRTRLFPDSKGDIFAPPKVPHIDRQVSREADVGPESGDGGGSVAQIQQDDGDVPVREQLAPDLLCRAVADNDALDPRGVARSGRNRIRM